MSNQDHENARSQARAQYESIAEMVAAADMDWDRLEELREERDSYQPEVPDDFPVQPIEGGTDNTATCGECGRAWDDAIPTEYTPAPAARCPFELFHASPEAWAQDNPEDADELQELEETAGDYGDADAARQAIQEDALSVEVRSGWTTPGEELEAEEFAIVLCTGGPAVRIRGEIGSFNEPDRAWLEYQDWFTPWAEYHGEEIDQDVLLTYCREFLGG